MSRTKESLKRIASGEEYKALVAAIEKKDTVAIVSSYIQVGKLLDEAQKEISEKIASLTRQNKEEDRQKFQAAFDIRVETTLPQFHWLNEELKKQKVTEGVVIGLGKQGDPMVRTPDGKLVIVKGAPTKEGDRVKIQITGEGPKVSFGKVFELSPDTLYFIMSKDIREKVRSSFASAREHTENYLKEPDKKGTAELGELLKELEDVKALVSGLQVEECKEISLRIQAFRRRLFASSVIKLAFDFLSKGEEKDIRESCKGDEELTSKASSAPGLLRRQSHEALKAELFAGGEPKGLSELTSKLESNIDTMESALKLMEFQTEIEEILPKAKEYAQKMDLFFDRLNERARRDSLSLAENKIFSAGDVETAIKNVFSNDALGFELRRIFRTPEDFYTLREAFIELIIRLGNKEIAPAEAAVKPYLRMKLAAVFGSNKVAA